MRYKQQQEYHRGGVLSPLLFNVYLEEALKTKSQLWLAATNGNLIAYADDIVVRANSDQDLLQLINEQLKEL